MKACLRSKQPARATALAVGAFVSLFVSLAMTGCSFTEVQPSAQRVEVLEAARVTGCDRLGETKVSVAEKVGFIARNTNAIHEDLQVLARNSAADMGGDTVTPIDKPNHGEQTFGVYDCVAE